jgi:thiol:disulfide interchange protein DsbD
MAKGEPEFLEPEQAFRVQAKVVDGSAIELTFNVADAYYLYREKFAFAALPTSLRVEPPPLPPGKVKFDQTFNKEVESYRGQLSIRLPFAGTGNARGEARITVTSQGCADAGLCYPPMESHFLVRGLATSDGAGQGMTPAALSVVALTEAQANAWVGGTAGGFSVALGATAGRGTAREDLSMAAVLQSGQLAWVVAAFFLAGVLLSFTPCVLPMMPILSSVIVGPSGVGGARRGFTLAAAYSLGMALVYTLMGVAAGLAGEGLGAALQNAWVLGAFALLLSAMAVSMFGGFQLQLPAALQTLVSQWSQRLPGGNHAAVFGMGALSALIVGPCVAAPLAGALIYIGQSRDAALGALALFAMAVGMSVPLLLLGASAGRLLPKAGAWMDQVRRLFGVLLLAVAIWMVSPVVSVPVQMGLWAVLLVGCAIALRAVDSLPAQAGAAARIGKAAGLLLLLVGVAQLVGALSGGRDVLRPLAHLSASAGPGGAVEGTPQFRTIKTVAELDAALQTAGRPVLLDFWAEWCVSCKEMERFTFSQPEVAARMSQALLLKADVTANTADDKALLKRFGLFGPPGIIFFDPQGRELTGVRVIGFQDATRFSASLQAAGL